VAAWFSSSLENRGVGEVSLLADREKQYYFERGLQYFAAGRFLARFHIAPVSGNQFHYAVEMFLKGQLCLTYTEKQRKELVHDLNDIWTEFKGLFPVLDLTRFDGTIGELDAFYRLRYPERVVREGMELTVSWARPSGPNPASGESSGSSPRYNLNVPDLDELIAELFNICSVNPKFYLCGWRNEAVEGLKFDNPACQSWF
jgi:hypothetical protein